ncbi:MAG TPA: Holliday junction resolvase RuvX [Alphaproteobacteria bacterium]|nr:Holliday junction resolvase RuvX [Alphaproteobacteria bacterium]
MPIRNPTELVQSLPRNARLLGVDVGEKTLGLALSDTTLAIASPLETLRRGRFSSDVETLKALIAKHAVGGIVVGLPINMDGSEGPRCQSVRAFAANLLARIDLPLAFWDERLSTVAVTRTMLEADLSRARRAKLVDKMAAAYILQGLLDRIRADRLAR